ncbi:hypothetical protein, partial [Streptomyces fildesensis]|uniref:hypothetical protein n=1 Tax=Streptomyces fildesensis TaxID=375757 RepID=UPI0018DF1043
LPLPLAEILNNEVENLVVSDSKLLHETELNPINSQDDPQPGVTNGMAKEESLIDSEVKVKQKLHHKENVISVESRKMLEMRAALKKKLK